MKTNRPTKPVSLNDLLTFAWIAEESACNARDAKKFARDAKESAKECARDAHDAKEFARAAKESAHDANRRKNLYRRILIAVGAIVVLVLFARNAKESARDANRKKNLYRRMLIGVGAIVVLVLFAIFLAWIILRPTKPEFVLQDTTLNALSLSQASILTTSMQITISIRNPNERVGIYYEQVGISVSYRNQKITETTELPPCTYMGHNEITAWSLFLNGTVPISPYLAAVVCEDFNGNIVLNIKVSARLKWKVGTWMFGNYRLTVKWSRVFHLQQTRWVSSFDGGKVSV